MKKFFSTVQNLSQKAAEIKAAIQQVPPKVAEIREAVAATTGQLQQLKSEIHFSVADLKADHEGHLSEALQEIHNSSDVFAKAGFALDGVDLELSPVQRILVHLLRQEDVHASVLRALIDANQHRRTTRAILSSLLQAKQMAETIDLGELVYNEVVVGIGPIPSVRLCWRPEADEVQAAYQPATAPKLESSPAPTATSPAPSVFASGSFFERSAANPISQPAAPGPSLPSIAIPETKTHTVEETKMSPAPATDPLARFKKMPVLGRH